MVVRSLFSTLKLFHLEGRLSGAWSRRVDSARWPNSIPPRGVAQGGLLIPVISSEFGIDGGGVEQNNGNGSGTSRSGL